MRFLGAPKLLLGVFISLLRVVQLRRQKAGCEPTLRRQLAAQHGVEGTLGLGDGRAPLTDAAHARPLELHADFGQRRAGRLLSERGGAEPQAGARERQEPRHPAATRRAMRT